MDIKNLKIRKRVAKASLTKLKDKININIENADTAELELFISKLRNLSDDIFDIFNKIYSICEEKEIDIFIEEQQGIQDILDELFLKVARVNSGNSNKSTSFETKNFEACGVNLPKLNLPGFSGDIYEWLSFSDLFKAAVTNNAGLSEAQKLQYLKCSLKGEALKIIQSLPVCDKNFNVAWELLSKRFSHKRELVSSLLKKILFLPSFQAENHTQLLNLVDIVRECVRSFEILGFKIEDFADTILMFITYFKLDPSTKGWWERNLKDDIVPKLDDLLEFLKSHSRTLQVSRSQINKTYSVQKVTSLVSEVQRCILCNVQHQLHKCSVFLGFDVQKRVNIVKTNKLCFNCFGNHRVINCKSSRKCKDCNKSHHTLLHFQRNGANIRDEGNLSADAKVFTPQFLQNSNVNGEGVNRDPSESAQQLINSCDSNFTRQILLCTAVIPVVDYIGHYQMCRALLDPGSEGSFITNDCLRRLGLQSQPARIPISCLEPQMHILMELRT